MSSVEANGGRGTRARIVHLFGVVEDIAYMGLGVLLGSLAFALLIASGVHMFRSIQDGLALPLVTQLLDRVLLTLLIVELLYTVQVSFREHALVPEPFLLVGLIAAIRRMLLLTAEYGELHEGRVAMLRVFAVELTVLTGLIVALVVALVLLRKAGGIRVERG